MLFPLCLGLAHQVWAETADIEPGTIVVTATRTAKVESEAPASVSVVTAREIENKHAQRLDEALLGAPGVFIRSLDGGQPSNWQNQVTLRGVPGYYRTGVLLDGVPLNNAFSGGVNMSVVPMEDIQQIEVVPGPFSSLYGGAGMAGVVNVITKSPRKRELSLSGEAGSQDMRSLSLGYRDKFKNGVGVSLAYGHKQADGYVREFVTKTPGVSGVQGSYDAYFKLNGKLSYRLSDRISASLAINNLLDREYYSGTFLADGRSYYTGLNAKF